METQYSGHIRDNASVFVRATDAVRAKDSMVGIVNSYDSTAMLCSRGLAVLIYLKVTPVFFHGAGDRQNQAHCCRIASHHASNVEDVTAESSDASRMSNTACCRSISSISLKLSPVLD